MSLADIAMGKKVNQPAQPTQPQGGVLAQGAQGSLPQQQGGAQGTPFNGVVDVKGKQVKVVNGTANVNGQNYHVANDGSMVINDQKQIIGYVEDGELKPMDEQHAAILKQKGYMQ